MYFTLDDYKNIENYLYHRTIKDTQFPLADPLVGTEDIPIIQDNRNKILKLKEFIKQVSELELPDFYNVSESFNRMYIPLKEAISLIPQKVRKLGLTITFLNENGNWMIYQFKGKSLNQWDNVNSWTNIIEEAIEELVYFPDEEDITSVKIKNKNYLKFNDKEYNQEEFSGLGRVFLRKNLMVPEDSSYLDDEDHFENILTDDMIVDKNTIYIIQYDYNLEGKTIEIPEGCVLWFQGGSFNNGTIKVNNTPLIGISKLEDIGTAKTEGVFNKGQILTFIDNKRQVLKWWNGNEWLLILDITDYNTIIDIIDKLIEKHNKEMKDCYDFFNNRCDRLQDNIDKEAETRAKEDLKLQGNIDKEIENRTEADGILDRKIDKEIEDREKADEAINSSIDKLKKKLTDDYATKKEVDQRIKDIINNAPEALDTLGEIADALKEDDDAIKAINKILEGKANSDDVYTKIEVDNLISDVNESIDAVDNKADSNKEEIDELRETIEGLGTSVSSLDERVTELENNPGVGDVDHTEINEAISSLDSRVTALENKPDTGGSCDCNTEEINSRLDDLEDRVTSIENSGSEGPEIDLSGFVKAVVIEDIEYLPNEEGRVIIPLASILEGLGITGSVTPDPPVIENPEIPETNNTNVTLIPSVCFIYPIASLSDNHSEPNVLLTVQSSLFKSSSQYVTTPRYVRDSNGAILDIESTNFKLENAGGYGIIVSESEEDINSVTNANRGDTSKYTLIPVDKSASEHTYGYVYPNTANIGNVLKNVDVNKFLNRKTYYFKGYVASPNNNSESLRFITTTKTGSFSGSRIINDIGYGNAITEWGIGVTQEDKPRYVDFSLENDTALGYVEEDGEIVVNNKLVFTFIITPHNLYVSSDSQAGIFMDNEPYKSLKGYSQDEIVSTFNSLYKGLVEFNKLPGSDNPISFNEVAPILAQDYEFIEHTNNKYKCKITLNMGNPETAESVNKFMQFGVILNIDSEDGESTFGMLNNRVHYLKLLKEEVTTSTEETVTVWKGIISEATYEDCDFTAMKALPR